MIYHKLSNDLSEIIGRLCQCKLGKIIGGRDHVHLLLMIPPMMSISNFMGYLKRKSTMLLLARHKNLKIETFD